MPRRPPPGRKGPPRPHNIPEQAIRFEYEADVLEGLERFAYSELTERLGKRVRVDPATRPGTLHFAYTGDLTRLLTMRSMLAIYLVVHFPIPRPRALLGHQHFEALVGAIDTVRALYPPEAYATMRLSAAGEDSSVLLRLKQELSLRTGLALADDEGDLLLRLRRATGDDGWEMLIRISPRPLATRPWRVCNLPGSLNATLAACMIELTEPSADDVVLNMACGSGTLLIERLAFGRPRAAIGCDTDPAALDCARANLLAAGYEREVRLEQWDAGSTPLRDASVSMICADLPFGQLVGSHRENEQLYPRVFAEAARVAAPGARMVVLTHEVRLLEHVAEQYAAQWSVQEVLRVRSGGMTPRVVLFQRTSAT
jgi:tRNA (guanine6-N2)-methyltransferase